MGGYPSATGYRFEAHDTGLKERIAQGLSIPLGADRDPDASAYEKELSPSARVKRDHQCMTTEDVFDNYDLYLNYVRGGPGFGDPLDRDVQGVQDDLNNTAVLPAYAERVYGAVVAQEEHGRWIVDVQKTLRRRAEIRRERIERSTPTREWMKVERERILRQDASIQVRHMFATSFGLSQRFEAEFKAFWNLPHEWTLREEDLGVPSFGSRHRMDLSQLPGVNTVVLVEQ
jgi:acetone carboxylase alpha subunit